MPKDSPKMVRQVADSWSSLGKLLQASKGIVDDDVYDDLERKVTDDAKQSRELISRNDCTPPCDDLDPETVRLRDILDKLSFGVLKTEEVPGK